MSVDLLVIVPSRGRPNSAKEIIQDFRATQSGRARLLFMLDYDDPALPDYLELKDLLIRGGQGDVWFDVGPRLRLCGSLNAAAVRNYQFYKYLAFWGDDVRPRTEGWDEATCEALSKSPASFCFWDDLFPGNRGRLPCHIAMTSDVVLALGYMGVPSLIHMHLDTNWKLWAETLGTLTYLSDVVIEHMHPDIGLGLKDATYHDTVAQYGPDSVAQNLYIRTELQSDIRKLRELLPVQRSARR